MDELEDRTTEELRRVARAHQLRCRGVGEGDHALSVHHDGIRRGLDQPAVTVFGLAKRLRGAMLLHGCSEDPGGRPKGTDLGR